MTPDELRRSQIAMALTKPVSRKMLDVMDMVIMPGMRDAIMLTLSDGGNLDMTARIERLVAELIDFLQRGDTRMERDVSLLMAKMIMAPCARSLDHLSPSTGTAQ